MAHMGNYYWSRTTFDLNVLRSKKYNRMMKLQKEASTYLNIQERKKLAEQIRWIDAVIDARRFQQSMFD